MNVVVLVSMVATLYVTGAISDCPMYFNMVITDTVRYKAIAKQLINPHPKSILYSLFFFTLMSYVFHEIIDKV